MNGQKTGLLNSWKEIANYLGRGVRTVQRWEKRGLPVRRMGSGSRAPVIANKPEIDRWMESTRAHGFAATIDAEQLFCRSELQSSILQSRTLMKEMIELRQTQAKNLNTLIDTIEALRRSCSDSAMASE